MLPELLREGSIPTLSDFKKTRHILEKFLSGGERKKPNPISKTFFGAKDYYERALPVKFKGKEYSLNFSTIPPVFWGDNDDNREIVISLRTKRGKEIDAIILPELGGYPTAKSWNEQFGIAKILDLLSEDILPLVERQIVKDGASKQA